MVDHMDANQTVWVLDRSHLEANPRLRALVFTMVEVDDSNNYTFRLAASSFDVIKDPNPHHPSAPLIRYLRVARADNRAEIINITGLELWSVGTRQLAVNGTVSPLPENNTDPKCCNWPFVNDEDPSTVGHTGLSKEAFIELDFGPKGRYGDTVKVLNRPEGFLNNAEVLSSRLNGCVLTATDIDGRVVLKKSLTAGLVHTFSLLPSGSGTVSINDFTRITEKKLGFLGVRADGSLGLHPNHTQRWQFVEAAGRLILWTDVASGGKATVLYRNPTRSCPSLTNYSAPPPVDVTLGPLPNCVAVSLGLSPVRTDPFEGGLVGWDLAK
jgi:hypothetical protein